MLVCSDGYERTGQLLRAAGDWLPTEQIEVALRGATETLLKGLGSLTTADRVSVGEGREQLLELINALMGCELVVTKRCGLLVLKFLSLFRCHDLPRIVVLDRSPKTEFNVVDISAFGNCLEFVGCEPACK